MESCKLGPLICRASKPAARAVTQEIKLLGSSSSWGGWVHIEGCSVYIEELGLAESRQPFHLSRL